jgi:tryptophan-rich sensory protein
MSAIGTIWLLVEILGLTDALRHAGPAWSYADRNRPFWLIFMFFFGPIFVLPYLFLVRPRFPGAAEQPDRAFRKL